MYYHFFRMRVIGMLLPAIVLGLAAHAESDRSDLRMPIFRSAGDPSASALSLGSVAMASGAGTTLQQDRSRDPYSFVIPSERSQRYAPGVWLRIPFGPSKP